VFNRAKELIPNNIVKTKIRTTATFNFLIKTPPLKFPVRGWFYVFSA